MSNNRSNILCILNIHSNRKAFVLFSKFNSVQTRTERNLSFELIPNHPKPTKKRNPSKRLIYPKKARSIRKSTSTWQPLTARYDDLTPALYSLADKREPRSPTVPRCDLAVPLRFTVPNHTPLPPHLTPN